MARLVDIEMRQNRLNLESLYRDPNLILTSTVSTIRLDTWETVRVQMAEMMPSQDFGSVAYYYLFLQELRVVATAQHQFSDPVALARDLLTEIRGQDASGAKVALKYSNMRILFGFRAGNEKLPLSPDNSDARKEAQGSQE